MSELRHAPDGGHNAKMCGKCAHRLAFGQFDPLEIAPDGLAPFCKTCVARDPWLMRATCRRCGSTRKISKFPAADQTRPCLVCEPNAGHNSNKRPVLLALESADLVPGAPKTAAELLEDIGFYEATRSDVIATGKWLAARGYERGYRSAQKVYNVGVRDLETGTLSDQLDDLDDLPAGRMTATEFLARVGLCGGQPSKADLNETAGWLRDQGFDVKRQGGRRVFDLGDDTGDDTTMASFARAFPALVSHLGLDADELRRLTEGATPDHRTRLAMSALIAGLPPYAAPGEKS